MGSKLGVVFAFIISLLAAGGSYYLYQDLIKEQTVRSGVEAKYNQSKEKIASIQSANEELETRSKEYRARADAMKVQLEKLQNAQNRLDTEKSSLEKQLKTHQNLITNLQKQVTVLEKKAQDAQAACGVTPADTNQVAFKGLTSSSQDTASTSSSEREQLSFEKPSREVTITDEKLSFKPITSTKIQTQQPKSFGTDSPPAFIPDTPQTTSYDTDYSSNATSIIPATSASIAIPDKKILTVNRKFNFVVINQGLNDGLRMGDRLKVIRNTQTIANIQVEKLYDKFSAATLLDEDSANPVWEGDEVLLA